jgi:ABC-type transporter Mla MlaB component
MSGASEECMPLILKIISDSSDSASGEIAEVRGDCVMTTVSGILKQGQDFIVSAHQPIFHLSKINLCDSASVALLLEWARYARGQGKTVQYLHLPERMYAMIRLSGLETVLRVTAA